MGIKVRFDGLDVMAMVSHLNHVALGRRVINIYEGDSSDSFLFKMDHNVNTIQANASTKKRTGANGNTQAEDAKEKLLLFLESGIRFHTTNRMQNNSANHTNATKNQPLAPFVFQLRKQLRGLRLESVTQLGQGDRVVHFVFGMGDARRALLLELYAKGNIVLCDAQYRILTLLRSHQYTSGSNEADNSHVGAVQVQIGHVYPVTYAARNIAASPSSQTESNNDTSTRTELPDYQDLSVSAGSSAKEWTAWAEQQVKQAAELAASTKASDTVEPGASNSNNSNAKNDKKWGKKKGKKGKKQAVGVVTLKTLLLKPSSGISHYGPNFLEHCILMTSNFASDDCNSSKLTPHTPLRLDVDNNLPIIADWEQFLKVLQEESAKLSIDPKAIAAAPPKGYILYSDKSKPISDSSGDVKNNIKGEIDDGKENNSVNSFADKVLEEFQPFLLLKQHEGRKVMEFETFDEAVDTFFGHLEAQKRLLRAEAAEQAAKDKLEKVRKDQQQRLQGLEHDVHKVQEQAQAVELNADSVEKALQVINSALDSGMDWDQLDQLVQVEQEENHNPIALLIYRLDLEHDSMVLELPTAAAAFDDESDSEQEDETDEDTENKIKKHKKNNEDETRQSSASDKAKVKKNHVLVSVSLKETAHGNASALFAEYRTMKEKSQRTVESSAKALKAAEENAQRQLADAQKRTKQATNTAVGQIMKPPWFTKFHWFITSDNYLVLGGRDAHQNEVLVKKYLRPGDAYLHADVHGAASCILRAKRVRVPVKPKSKKKGASASETLPLSDQALREAGNFTICRSSAWASKMVTSAWWVESHQVSKTAPTGEYLKVGAFMIRGKKNFLPPTPLEMGLGIMFRLATPDGTLDPATYARHKNERRDFAMIEILQQHEDDGFSDDNSDDTDHIDSAGIADDVDSIVDKGSRDTIQHQDIQHQVEKKNYSEACDAAGKPVGSASIAENSTSEKIEHEARLEKSHLPVKTPPEKKKKKGLSIKERKLIKKYGSLEEAEKVLSEREKEEEREKQKQLIAASVSNGDEDDECDDTNDQGTIKRGRKGKKKKLLKKYADQDDEDRELAMLALQVGEKVKKAKGKRLVDPTTEEQKQAAAETAALLVKDASDVAEHLPEDVRSVLAECVTVQQKDSEPVVRWDKFDADVIEQLILFEGPPEAKLAAAKRLLFLKSTTRVDNFSASLSGILRTIRKWGFEQLETDTSANIAAGSKRKTNEDKRAVDAEWKETLAEEGVATEEVEVEGEEIDDTAENNKLTGKPHPEDALLYALPVCAPYQTLTQYTYRIKLTPGNMKRGKAARQCVDMFLKGDRGGVGKQSNTGVANSGVGKEFIKKVADNDWIQCLCADVKISAPGAAKNIKKQKANNKAKAKKKN